MFKMTCKKQTIVSLSKLDLGEKCCKKMLLWVWCNKCYWKTLKNGLSWNPGTEFYNQCKIFIFLFFSKIGKGITIWANFLKQTFFLDPYYIAPFKRKDVLRDSGKWWRYCLIRIFLMISSLWGYKNYFQRFQKKDLIVLIFEVFLMFF